MRSFFSKRNTGTQSRKRKQVEEVDVDGVPIVFKGDESLIQIHTETAELLRLVKTPAKTPKRSTRVGASKAGKTRHTIEVLDDYDEEDEIPTDGKVAENDKHDIPPEKSTIPVDPSAEEACIRQPKDACDSDRKLSKCDVEWQKSAFQRGQDRQDEVNNEKRLCASQTSQSNQQKREVALDNRLKTSAIIIQAHFRGFLCRRRKWLQQKEAAVAARVDSSASKPNRIEPESNQWHEVHDVERGEVWYYNASTGVSQWEPPPGQASTSTATSPSKVSTSRSLPTLSTNGNMKMLARSNQQRLSSGIDALPALSPVSSLARSSCSEQEQQQQTLNARKTRKPVQSPRNLPVLQPEHFVSSPNPWECDSVLLSGRSLSSEHTEDAGRYADSEADEMDQLAFDKRRSLSLRFDEDREDDRLANEDGYSDWQMNDSLFRADGTKNSKLRDTIRSALNVSKFDSISSLIASNVVLRRKPIPGNSPHKQGAALGSRRREIVLGKREEPMFVAVLARDRNKRLGRTKDEDTNPKSSMQSSSIRSTAKAATRGNRPPHIRNLVDPGFDEQKTPQRQQHEDEDSKEAARREAVKVCFNCWSASNGRHCDIHEDPRDTSRKLRPAESALMCANWELDQLRRKYRAEEIQEIFMKQRATLRYDRKLQQYVTVIECRHPVYRAVESLLTVWNKALRRKLHTRSWFRSFLEHIRTNRLPASLGGSDETNRLPPLSKLKNTLQNSRWVSRYSENVCKFHPQAPVTTKDCTGNHLVPLQDVVMIHPARPQWCNWILVTEYTKPQALYKPRVYELPPVQCVPMPAPSFSGRLALPVPNVQIDAGHSASWLERLAAHMAITALQKAVLQIGTCSLPHGSTGTRRTKHVEPFVALFATFSRKPTPGNLDVGGLSAELLIHMLVTTYIPAQFGNFVVFDRRAVAPAPLRDETVTFSCLVVQATALEYVFRALEHALNTRKPPCIVVAARVNLVAPSMNDDVKQLEACRFPLNRPEQTGEKEAHGFRTFWLVDPFPVPDQISGVRVVPSSAILAPNVASTNATVTTRVDRTYPFCVPTTRENTPIEFMHLLWIGQSSRNQPQAFTTLGRQQPGDFMKNSDPNGALGPCSSIVYRSWAYMQSSPFDEFVTENGVAYWYDRNTGDTFWKRPILPTEKFRGKDGDIDGVITTGEGEVATLGVGLTNSANADGRCSQQNLRKYMMKKMEAPGEKERRVKLVTASARKHDVDVDLTPSKASSPASTNKGELKRIQVPRLSLKHHKQRRSRIVGSRASSASSMKSQTPTTETSTHETAVPDDDCIPSLDSNTKQMIESITQALGSALPALSQANGATKGASVDMLQLGIGLGMGLGMRVQQQSVSPVKLVVGPGLPSASSEPVQQLQDIDFDEQGEGDDDNSDKDSDSSRSETSSIEASLLSVRSECSAAPSVDILPTPDDVEFDAGGPHVGKKTAGYTTHPPPGEGTSWIRKPVDGSGESQTAVEGFGGALHQRVTCLPKDFIAAVTCTKTCAMQTDYLPVVKNMNQPRSIGIVRPRRVLEDWLAAGYSPWAAGRIVFGTQFVEDLMLRPELLQNTADIVPGTAAKPVTTQMEKRDAVSQAVKESEQLDNIFSLCRHGKYYEVELLLNSPDWSIGIDAKDASGNTLLLVACQNNNKRIARLCMRRGANINVQNLNGQSLLHYCHEYGFHDLMEYLVEKGARDDLLNADGLTCYEGLSQEAVDAI